MTGDFNIAFILMTDLFIYREHKPSSKGAVAYPRVDWFDHDNIADVQKEPNEDGKR